MRWSGARRGTCSEIETLDGVSATLGWDEQTYMPKKAAALRGAQMAHARRASRTRAAPIARIGRVAAEGLDAS
jgi:Zn-dependent M32 family carboxypeptidase